MKHIAIIGSGPAGCYLADQLLRLLPEASVDILERLPKSALLVDLAAPPGGIDFEAAKALGRKAK